MAEGTRHAQRLLDAQTIELVVETRLDAGFFVIFTGDGGAARLHSELANLFNPIKDGYSVGVANHVAQQSP